MSKKKKKNRNTQRPITIVTPETTTIEFVPFEFDNTIRQKRVTQTEPMAVLHYSNKYNRYTRLALNKTAGEIISTLDLKEEDGAIIVDVLINKNTNEILIREGTTIRMTSKMGITPKRYGINNTSFCKELYDTVQAKKFKCKLWKDEGIILEPVKED